MGKWLEVIIIGTYQSEYEDSRWSYEKVPDLCPDVDLGSDSSYDGSSDELIKDQDIPDDQEQD